jgi:hypothetical protein
LHIGGLSLDESIVALKILMVGIGLENPPSSAVYASDMPTLFTVAEAKLIIDYLDIRQEKTTRHKQFY